jgi:hypothetical protein
MREVRDSDACPSLGAVDDAVFAAIEAERRPEIEFAQAGQLRAYGMVQKPLAVQHLMFTMLGAVMAFKKFGPPSMVPAEPRYLPVADGFA